MDMDRDLEDGLVLDEYAYAGKGHVDTEDEVYRNELEKFVDAELEHDHALPLLYFYFEKLRPYSQLHSHFCLRCSEIDLDYWISQHSVPYFHLLNSKQLLH